LPDRLGLGRDFEIDRHGKFPRSGLLSKVVARS
jgi:hypothetical protein